LAKKHGLKTFVLFFILFGVYLFVFGESGVLERIKLNKKAVELEKKISILNNKNRQLSDLNKKYRGNNFPEKDLLESGFVVKNGQLIFIRGLENKEIIEPESSSNGIDTIEVSHLRVIWLIVSSLILLLYFSRGAGGIIIKE